MEDTNGLPMTHKEIIHEILSWLLVIAVAFVLAFVITHFVIIKAQVPSGSMENTIQIGDRLIGLRTSYLFSDPKRGDIIIFKYPDDESQDFIKRIIGLPGETVTITDGVVYVDGVELKENYIKEPMDDEDYGPYVVPADSYFVMGDNRNDSKDSRFWSTTNYVKRSQILGKAWFRYSPSFSKYKSVDYSAE